MFFIYTIQDKIVVNAGLLGKDLIEIIRQLIKEKYVGKMIQEEGLCISLVNFHTGQTIVNPGEGDLVVAVR